MEDFQETRILQLKESVKDFPSTCGIYLMKDHQDVVIYVGKAKILINRVRSYFIGSKDIKTQTLIRHVSSLEYIITHTEYEALLLENELIKKHSPRFNILLKDGKSYSMIKLTKEDFPRLYKTRRFVDDGSQYFGPYPNIRHIDLYLELADKLFPLRKCKGPLRKRTQPCLYYHIGKCLGPCIGKINQQEYLKYVAKVNHLLKGRTTVLKEELTSQMKKASAQQRFEVAAELRDTLKAIQHLEESQKVIDLNVKQRDYIGMASEADRATFVILQMRGGKLMDRDLFHTEFYSTEDEAFEEFLLRYYSDHQPPQDTVYLSKALPVENLKKFLRRQGDSSTEIVFPESGHHQAIMRMALENALVDLKNRLETGGNQHALLDLKAIFHLTQIPHRIEGFDISHLDGTYTVASLVSFWNGNPDKKNYRKFRLRSLQNAIDDFQAMKEVLARRYSRLLNENKTLPHLILIDGGKGQVTAAFDILQALGLDIPLVGLAKKKEELFLPHRSAPIILPQGSPALRILQAVRDESHRFATNFNKLLHSDQLQFSLLESIPGIAQTRSRKLIQEFGNLETLTAADPSEVAFKVGISLTLAQTVKTYLTDKENRRKTVQKLKRSRHTQPNNPDEKQNH